MHLSWIVKNEYLITDFLKTFSIDFLLDKSQYAKTIRRQWSEEQKHKVYLLRPSLEAFAKQFIVIKQKKKGIKFLARAFSSTSVKKDSKALGEREERRDRKGEEEKREEREWEIQWKREQERF